jgi:hypothetical protein
MVYSLLLSLSSFSLSLSLSTPNNIIGYDPRSYSSIVQAFIDFLHTLQFILLENGIRMWPAPVPVVAVDASVEVGGFCCRRLLVALVLEVLLMEVERDLAACFSRMILSRSVSNLYCLLSVSHGTSRTCLTERDRLET